MKYILPIVIASVLGIGLRAHNPNTEMNDLQTNPGDVKVMPIQLWATSPLLLYDDTPLHTANFVKLVNEGFYDGLLFHRVIDSFMIQGGDPTQKMHLKGKHLEPATHHTELTQRSTSPSTSTTAERLPLPAKAMPQTLSANHQAHNSTLSPARNSPPAQLDQMEHKAVMRHKQEVFDSLSMQHRDSIMAMRRNRDQAGLEALREQLAVETERLTANDSTYFTPEQRDLYMREGGTPHLDGAYTVFGRVISGMDTVDKIQKVETDGYDRPLEDVKIISAKILP